MASSSSLPPDLKLATFLYLNPQLQASGEVVTVEDVVARYSAYSALPYKLPPLPDGFDARLYIADNRDVMDVSVVASNVRAAMVAQGWSLAAIEKQAQYVGTVFRQATPVAYGSNGVASAFTFVDASYAVTSCNLRPGDQLKVSRSSSNHDYFYGTVTATTSDGFSLDRVRGNAPFEADPAPADQACVVYGLRLVDYERVALVDLARKALAAAPAPLPPVPAYSREFNLDLYQALYPDARVLTLAEAYVDYEDNWGAGSYRIVKASDLQNVNAPVTGFESLAVTNDVSAGRDLTAGRNLSAGGGNLLVTPSRVSVRDTLAAGSSNLVVTPSAATLRSGLAVAGTLAAGGGAVTVTPSNAVANVPVTLACNVDFLASPLFHGPVQAPVFLALQAVAIGGAWSQTFDFNAPSGASNASNLSPPPPWTYGGGGGDCNSGGEFDRVVAQTVQAASNLLVGDNGWSFADNDTEALPLGALTLSHPEMVANGLVHVYDTDGRVGVGIGRTLADASPDFLMTIDGDVFTTGQVVTQSDARFKTDLRRIDRPLDRVCGLTGYTYTPAGEAPRSTGLLAQDVQVALPEAMHVAQNGTMSVAYGNLAGLFAEAFKELRAEVRRLEAALGAGCPPPAART
jgi:hypothetical protein